MMQIIITGKNSFIGKNIIENFPDFQFTEIDTVGINASDFNLQHADTVIHLAAIVHQKKSIPEETYYKINTDLAVETAKAAKNQGVKHFVFFSTVKVYGDGSYNNIIYNESSECLPVDAYGKSKKAAEEKIFTLADEDFKVSIIRPCVVYGKGVKANMLMLCKLIKKMPVIPLGRIRNKRSMVSISNLMITLNSILNEPKTGVFLACDKETVSTSEIAEKLIQIINPKKKLIYLPDFIVSFLKIIFPHQMIRLYGSFHVDAAQTHKLLKIEDKLETIESGLKKMLKDEMSMILLKHTKA
jgi:UDP-glucose 4-epimerase